MKNITSQVSGPKLTFKWGSGAQEAAAPTQVAQAVAAPTGQEAASAAPADVVGLPQLGKAPTSGYSLTWVIWTSVHLTLRGVFIWGINPKYPYIVQILEAQQRSVVDCYLQRKLSGTDQASQQGVGNM